MFFKSPLALAIMFRGGARSAVGIPGWMTDYRDAIAMARAARRDHLSVVVFYVYVVRNSIRFPSDGGADRHKGGTRARGSGRATRPPGGGPKCSGIVLAYRDEPECDEGVALLEPV